MKKYRHTIYLAKDNVDYYSDVLSETGLAYAKGEFATINPVNIDDEFEKLSIIFHGYASEPKWAVQIRSLGHDFPSKARGKYPAGIVFLKVEERIFVVTFGGGHHYIDKSKLVLDFGLKTVVNSVADEKVRALEKSNLGDLLRGVSQAAFESGLQVFDVRSSLDVIHSISGSVKDDANFGDKATGSTALKITSSISLSDIHEICSDALIFYASEAYKQTSFAIIDNLLPIKEIELVARAESALLRSVLDDDGGFELSVPETFGLLADIAYARVTGAGHTTEYPDITLSLYREIVGDELENLTIDDLKRHQLEVFFGDGNKAHGSSVYKCLVGSVDVDDQKFVINEGNWYQINNDYKETIEATYQYHRDEAFDNSLPAVEIVEKQPHKKSERKKGATVLGYEDESVYNQRVANQFGWVLLDRDTVAVPDQPNNKIEVCDLLDVKNKRLIHVKKSSRSSSVLSHFFKQGANPTQLIYNNNEFRNSVEEKISLLSDDQFQFGDLREYSVIFVIADQERKAGGHNIPFFSKISFKDDCERIAPISKEVKICFVTQPEVDLSGEK